MTGSTAIIGLGGVGGNSLVYLSNLPGMPERMIYADTRQEAVEHSIVKHTLLLGQAITKGMATGGNTEIGEAVMRADPSEVLAAIGDAENAITIAGMAGGTGGGGANVLIPALAEAGKRVLLVAIMPFDFEDSHRKLAADENLARHVRAGVETIVLHNQRLMQTAPTGATFAAAFNIANEALYETLSGMIA